MLVLQDIKFKKHEFSLSKVFLLAHSGLQMFFETFFFTLHADPPNPENPKKFLAFSRHFLRETKKNLLQNIFNDDDHHNS